MPTKQKWMLMKIEQMTMIKKALRCKHRYNHVGPMNYAAWHEWAVARVADGWRQLRCKKCQLFVVWVRPCAKRLKQTKRGKYEV